jgi:hypothetical protein
VNSQKYCWTLVGSRSASLFALTYSSRQAAKKARINASVADVAKARKRA